MRHNLAHRRLGRTTQHRLALFRNMLSALVARDRIETTLAKARELRPLADRLVTLAKKGELQARRHAFKLLRDDTAVKKLFSTLVDRFRDRKGGYTRILKLGYRHGDSAPMAMLEYLTAEIRKEAKRQTAGGREEETKKKAKKSKKVKKEKK